MAKDRPDFVMVRLTARGQELAGANPLSVANGRRHYSFQGAAAQEAEKSYDWNIFLRNVRDSAGAPLFELVPDATAVAAAATAVKAPAVPTIPAAADAAATTTEAKK